MKNKIIIYEKLNLFTFCISLIGMFIYHKQYFIDFSPFLKKYISCFIKKKQIKQLHLLKFLDCGLQAKYELMIVDTAKKIVDDSPELTESLANYLNDKRAKSLIEKVLSVQIFQSICKFIIVKEYIDKNKNKDICYFPTAKNIVTDYLKSAEENLLIIKWHCLLLNIINIINKLICFYCLLITPVFIFLRLLYLRKISFKNNSVNRLSKNVIYFHVQDVVKNALSMKIFYRRLYLFHAGVLKISDCIHACTNKPLSKAEVSALRYEGGETYNYQLQKIDIKHIMKRIFVDYYLCFSAKCYRLSFFRYSSLRLTRSIIGLIIKIVEVEYLLKNIDVKLAYFENEYNYIAWIFTICGNKYNIKTMTMTHGVGGYSNPNPENSFAIFNYYLVPGNYFRKHMKYYNPHVDRFCPIGNHEIDYIHDKDVNLLRQINCNMEMKVVGILANYYWPYFPKTNSKLKWPLFDENDAKDAFMEYWGPFFKWVAKQDNLFFIFKSKPRKQYEHPFIKRLMDDIPDNIYYQNDYLSLIDVVDVSDCIVGVNVSSALYLALCSGVPAISYSQLGQNQIAEYDKNIFADRPDELIHKLEYLLSNGLPNSVYERVRKDHYADGVIDYKVVSRIKRLIAGITEEINAE